jgi:sigma-B regulation protein RsbU (phosphoserine phosphatase)
VLGAIERQRYTVQEGTLQPGDRLVFYTDGVTEARGPNKSLYGSKALAALLAETPDGSARALCERVVQTITAYQNGELADDATVMVLKRTGALAAVGAATAPSLSSGA